MKVDVVLGLQWGDEGKGKIVDVLAKGYPVVARFQGGPNAGHSLHFEEKKFVLHTIPSGVFRKGTLNIIGNGVVIDPIIFKAECEEIEESGVPAKERIAISKKAHQTAHREAHHEAETHFPIAPHIVAHAVRYFPCRVHLRTIHAATRTTAESCRSGTTC